MKRSGVVAWCPLQEHAPLLACGTAAGSISDFGASTAQLEVMSCTSSDAQDKTMPVLGSLEVQERFHCTAWGKGDSGTPYGLIAGGMANGSVTISNPGAIVKGQKEAALLSVTDKHAGPVQGLDFNPSQPNLLASGGAEAEIYIWDVSSPSTPKNYTPGAKVSQQTDITCLQWNPKVPYILASTAYNGVSVVWDLRAKRPVITFSDPSRKTKCRTMAWNPIEPMQIVTASEEDSSPVIQVWDLRNTYSPSKYLEGHTKGIWSVSWCPVDPALLLSCGKHTEIFCWNMQTGRIQCEVETTNSWNSNIQWAPHIPSLFSVCSLEGQVKIFSLQDPTPRVMGGSTKHVDFSHPPKWLKKPVGASFGFGGKLFSFNEKSGPSVSVRTLVTDPEFVSRADRLEKAVTSGDFKGFCDDKAHEATNPRDKQMWSLMKVLFESDARSKLLAELEYGPEAIKQHITEVLSQLPDQSEANKPEEKLSPPASKEKEEDKEKEKVPDVFAEHEEKKELDEAPTEEAIPFDNVEPKGDDVSNLFGFSAGPSTSFNVGTATEGEGDLFGGFNAQPQDDPFAAIAASHQAAQEQSTQPISGHERSELAQKLIDPIEFDTSNEDTESLITRALIVGNFALGVDICFKSGRMADALVLAACGGPDLWAKTQDRYFNQNRAPFMRLIASIVKDKLQDLVAQTNLRSWKGTLAVLCTYAKSDEFPVLCDFLGHRLEEAGDSDSAVLCYMCAGNIEKTVSAWAKQAVADRNKQTEGASSLVELLEKVNVFRKAIDFNDMNEVLASKYSQYAGVLAAQGQLPAAMRYLSFLSDPKFNTLTGRDGAILLDRVYHALGTKTGPAPPAPFAVEEVRADQRMLYSQQPQQPQQPQYNQFGQGQPSGHLGGQPTGHLGGQPSGHVGGQPSGGYGQQSYFGGQPSGGQPSGGHVGGPSGFSPTPKPAPTPATHSHFGGQPSPMGGQPSGYGGQPSPMGGQPSGFGGHPSPMGGQPSGGFGGAPKPAPPMGGQPSGFGGHPSAMGGHGGQPSPHVVQPSTGFGGQSSSMGGQQPSGFGGQLPPMGGQPPSSFGHVPPPMGGPSTMGGLPPVSPSHLGAGPSVVGGQPPVPTAHQHAPAQEKTPPASLEKGPSIPSNTHLKTKEEKAPGSGQPTQLGTTILNKYGALIDTFSVQFASDARKARNINDAKSRLEPLFTKVRNGELSAGAEGTLLDLVTALERGDKNTAHNLHKEAAGKYWEELSSAVMIGMKRLIDIL